MLHMPILRTEAARGERVNAEPSWANQVRWLGLGVGFIRISSDAIYTPAPDQHTNFPCRLVNTTKGPRELLNIDEER